MNISILSPSPTADAKTFFQTKPLSGGLGGHDSKGTLFLVRHCMSRKKSWRSPDWEFSQSRKDEAHVRLSLGNHNILVTSINDNFLDASVALLL